MKKCLVKSILILALVCEGPLNGGWLNGAEAQAATIQLPKTGQTQCYGTTTSCTGTGQDGEKQMGVARPVPRFKNNSSNSVSNGTVTDNLTGLIWLKNASCFGVQDWATALNSANTLVGNNSQCGLNDGSAVGDWRLPSAIELKSLINWGETNSSTWLMGNGFSAVQGNNYWSSNNTTTASYVNMYDGSRYNYDKAVSYYVWPVRGGQSGKFGSLSISPDMDFGNVITNTSAAQTFTINYTGVADQVISSIAIIDNTEGMFAVDVGNGLNGTCGPPPTTIASGGSCTVSVTFSPTSGVKTAHLRIRSNDPSTPKDFALTGTGVEFIIGTGVVGGNGTIVCDSPVASGATSICTITPSSGYHLATFTDDSVDKLVYVSANAYSITSVSANHTVAGTFAIDTFAVTFTAGTNGSLTGTASQTINYAASATAVTAVPATGYHFVNWTGTGGFVTSTTNPLTVANVTADHSIAGTFAANPINGTCGSSNGTPFTIAPAANLCATGTASSVSGSGPWTWSCDGSNGGTTASCFGYVQGTVVLPKTGQTACYNTAGTAIDCAGTGQDGEKQMGASQSDPLFTDNGTTITDKVFAMTWSKNAGLNGTSIKTGIAGVPSPRFTDNNNGTQTDNLTGLVWLKNANCFGTQTWANALTSANTLASTNSQCGLSDGSAAGDWRLPNVNELASLPTNYTGSPSEWLNDIAQGFTTVQAYYYWSSTTFAYNTDYAWYVIMNGGSMNVNIKAVNYYVWPVRGGQSGALGTLSLSKTGNGSVSSNPAGISCGTNCTSSFAGGKSVVLTATAGSGDIFTAWTGCDSVNNTVCTVTASGAKNVTAVFATSYTVSFESNGGSGTLPTQVDVATAGTFAVAAGTGLTKAGYTFSGWNDGTNTYAAGATYTMGASNVTLTAQWTINSYTVNFDINGGTGGTMSSQSAYYNVATALTANNFTKTGYSFAGWNTLASGSGTAYVGGASYPFITSTTLYAQWTAITFTVTPSSGTGSSMIPAIIQTVNSGATTSFTITPDSGYGILSVTGCNGALSGTTYTTGVITGNCAVAVTAIKRGGSIGTVPTISDALKTLQAFNGTITLTPEEIIRYDVAPVAVNGIPQGNSVIDVADVILILRRSIGIGSW